ncbi:MAG: TPM domain-containing protein [Veillonellaceae bacterium]|nr:TPM domain-containing protein [Veillonellaceae bacterium]
MKKWLAWLLFVFYLMLSVSAWAQPQIPPVPTSSIYVQDYAGVLSGDNKARINQLGSQIAAKSKAQVVVVTVKTLDGAPIDEYALSILRKWGIGDKKLNNGVLMLIAVNDRQSRIEVGYGLEGALPDAKTGRIQDKYMIPYFQRGDYNTGIYNGYQALIGEVAKEYNIQVSTDAKAVVQTNQIQTSMWDDLPWWAQILIVAGFLLLFIIDWMFFGGSITYLILSLIRFRGGGGGGGGGHGGYGGGSGGGGGSSRNW